MDLITIGIIVVAAIDFAGIIWSWQRFSKVYDNFEKKCYIKTPLDYEEAANDTRTEYEVKTSYSLKVSQYDVDENRDMYEKYYATYVIFSQIISLFPLMGIFGTVYGLVKSQLDNVDSLVQGLGVALNTTLWGLIASLVLKFVDAFTTGRMINLIDASFNKADTISSRQALRDELAKTKNAMMKGKL